MELDFLNANTLFNVKIRPCQLVLEILNYQVNFDNLSTVKPQEIVISKVKVFKQVQFTDAVKQNLCRLHD
ncbi:MAG: hypothetical protein IPM47_02500 [Sphingobacteriales bacterium]|nr:MAG: hypothetical protein IPM47_02500 [Sphingobacteriales bacterium]